MTEPTNVVAAFFRTAVLQGRAPCVHFKRDGVWRTESWAWLADTVCRVAAGLKRRGLKPGEKVAIFASSRLEWTIADLAIMAVGAISIPIYRSLAGDRLSFILGHSEPRMAIVENDQFAALLEETRRTSGIPHDVDIIAMEEGGPIPSLTQIGEEATSEETESITQGALGLSSDDVATIVYTSGTTGELKGVVLTHKNLLAEIQAAQRVFSFSSRDICMLCLPLAHVLGRMTQFYVLIQGCQAAYAESLERLPQNYLEVRPHFVVAVPRMLEKIQERVHAHLEGSSRLARGLFDWALSVGRRRSALLMRHRRVPWSLSLRYRLADLLVFRKLRARLGGRLRIIVSGGAYLPEEVAEFFHAAGMTIQEGYGLTETFAAATVNRTDDFRFGTVGKPLPGIELKIADDGEVLLKGPTIFKGYFKNQEEASISFDEKGWFRTGDLGEYTKDGFLRITGRKKDIIVTAGGKNVAPQLIESVMLSSPYIDYFVVCGEGRKYLTALVVLNAEAVRGYLLAQGYVAQGSEPLGSAPLVKQLIGRHIEEQNKRLASYETIKRFSIVEGDFSVENGALTPTLKVRRSIVADRYRDILDGLYRD
jgi:long-chain acyl-CoA synthetase